MIQRLDYRPTVLEELSRGRWAAGAISPASFALIYLSHHFHKPPSRMHQELFELLTEASAQRGQHLAVAAPRGHAKTTLVSLAYVLWSVLYAKERFVLIVSATREQAVQLLADIRRELTGNERLLTDFPEICMPLVKARGPVTVKAHHLVLANDVCVRVLGSGQGLRGMKHRQHRPTLIIGDDLEELEQAQSEDQRQKLRDWFARTLLKAGTSSTNVIVIGTILHYDSLLAQLTDRRQQRDRSGGWTRRIYQAVESFSTRGDLWDLWEAIRFGEEEFEGHSGLHAAEAYFQAHRDQMLQGASVLWPAGEDYYQLMCTRADEGRASFQAEKQNEPLDAAHCLFRPESFRYWDPGSVAIPGSTNHDTYADTAELLAALGDRAEIYGACDPSLGKRAGRGDYSAVVTLVKDDRTNLLYVIGAHIAKRNPDQVIEHIIQLARIHSFRKFAVESNQFQELMADQLQQRARAANVYLRLEKITTTTNKQGRIEALEPLISQGMIRFSRRHQMLLDQLRQFPLGAHDDGPDALEMAVSIATKRAAEIHVFRFSGV
jgi:predicted phage terminase large subunit-like protein